MFLFNLNVTIKGYRPDFCDIHTKLSGVVVCQVFCFQLSIWPCRSKWEKINDLRVSPVFLRTCTLRG